MQTLEAASAESTLDHSNGSRFPAISPKMFPPRIGDLASRCVASLALHYMHRIENTLLLRDDGGKAKLQSSPRVAVETEPSKAPTWIKKWRDRRVADVRVALAL